MKKVAFLFVSLVLAVGPGGCAAYHGYWYEASGYHWHHGGGYYHHHSCYPACGYYDYSRTAWAELGWSTAGRAVMPPRHH